jgi:hypothetical protein
MIAPARHKSLGPGKPTRGSRRGVDEVGNVMREQYLCKSKLIVYSLATCDRDFSCPALFQPKSSAPWPKARKRREKVVSTSIISLQSKNSA